MFLRDPERCFRGVTRCEDTGLDERQVSVSAAHNEKNPIRSYPIFPSVRQNIYRFSAFFLFARSRRTKMPPPEHDQMSPGTPNASIANSLTDRLPSPSPSPWPETDWGQVLALRDPAAHAEALTEICSTYHPVILRALRKRDAANAEDLAQGFVMDLIQNHRLDRADPDAGRFRHYLGKMLENFTRKQHRDGNRQKRGGAVVHLELRDDSVVVEPEGTEIFDREWAKALMGRVVDAFKAEEARPDLLRIALRELAHMGDDSAVDEGYAGLSERTGIPESTLRSEVTRMRRRFHERLKQEVALTTVRSEIGGEIRYLLKALGE